MEFIETVEKGESMMKGDMNRDEFIEWLQSPEFILSIVIIAAAFICWKVIKKALMKYDSKKGLNKYKFTISILKGLFIAVIAVFVLEINGVNVSTLVAGFGVASVVVAFSLQDILKDTIMGLHIMSDEYFKVGDVVSFDGIEGVVESFTLRTTKIRSIINDDLFIVSNREIEKITRRSGLCDIDVPLPYSEDPDDMHKLMEKIADRVSSMEGIEKAEYKGTQAFNDSSISYKLRFFCDPAKKPQYRRNVLIVIQDELKKAGVSIPFNQLDVHRID